VPVPNLIAFTSGNRNLNINPLSIGDQTLWALGTASHGRVQRAEPGHLRQQAERQQSHLLGHAGAW